MRQKGGMTKKDMLVEQVRAELKRRPRNGTITIAEAVQLTKDHQVKNALAWECRKVWSDQRVMRVRRGVYALDDY